MQRLPDLLALLAEPQIVVRGLGQAHAAEVVGVLAVRAHHRQVARHLAGEAHRGILHTTVSNQNQFTYKRVVLDILAERGHQVIATEAVGARVEAAVGLVDALHLGLRLRLCLEHLRDGRLLEGGWAGQRDAGALLVQMVQNRRNRRHFLRGQQLRFFRLLLEGVGEINRFGKLILTFVCHRLF
jgi:hypothetical protein